MRQAFAWAFSSANLEPGLCRCVGNQIDDDVMTDQSPVAPVLSDVAEHAVLDLVPLAGAWWKVAHMDWRLQAHCQLLKGDLPQGASTTVVHPALRARLWAATRAHHS